MNRREQVLLENETEKIFPEPDQENEQSGEAVEDEKVPQEISADDEEKLHSIRDRITRLFNPKGKEVGTLETEEMKKTFKALQKISEERALIETKISNRRKWLPSKLVQQSRLMQRHEALLQRTRELAAENFTALLEGVHLNPKLFFRAISLGNPTRNFAEALQENLEIIEELERRLPGSSARLVDNYGIRNFARYPIDILIQQLEDENNTESPYGIALYSQNDWNGALSKTSKLDTEELIEKTEQVGLKVRIIECSSVEDTARRLIKLDKKYGEQQKIQFAVVSAHGSEKSIELGSKSLTTDALPENALKKIADFFAENPTVILHACSTGSGESGIAQVLAQVTNAEVLATGYETNGIEIRSIEKTDEGYKFETVFDSTTLFGMWTRREKTKPFQKQ